MLLTRSKLARFFFHTLASNRSALALHFLGTTSVQLLFYAGLMYGGGWALVGVWGWIMAAVALMPLFLLGWSQGLLKLLPTLGKDQQEKRQALASTALIGAVLIPVGMIALLYGITFVLPKGWSSGIPDLSISPNYRFILIAALLLVPINLTIQQLLDAQESFVLRTVTQGHALLGLVITSFLLYPWLQTNSLVVALLVQQVLLLTRGWRILRFLQAIPDVNWIRWDRLSAKALFQFGIRYQQASMLSAMFEPIAKAALTRMGGLDWVGIYELASRVIQPLRGLLVQQLQVLTPRIAQLEQPALQRPFIQEQLGHHTRQTGLICWVTCSLLALFAWISSPSSNHVFLTYAAGLLVVWTLNLWAVPLYYTALARGKLHHLTLVHVIQTGMAGLCWWKGEIIIQSISPPLAWLLPSAGVGIGALYLGLVYRSWIPKSPWHADIMNSAGWILFIAALLGSLWFTPWALALWSASCFIWGGWIVVQALRAEKKHSLFEDPAAAQEQQQNSTPLKISVVTVCLNRAHLIEDTIRSVQQQTYPHIEHIIVDGGSTDGTLDILRAREKQLAVWISEPDRNMYDAINKGCALATGDYIHVLNSDDYLASEEVYEQVVQQIIRSGRKGLYHGDLIKLRAGQFRRMHLFGVAYLPYLFSTHGTFISHPTAFIRKDMHEKLGGYRIDFPFSSDYDYLLRACRLASSDSHYFPIAVTCFREHDQSATYSGMLNADKRPILEAHGYFLYPSWYRMIWWLCCWGYYKWRNPSKHYSQA